MMIPYHQVRVGRQLLANQSSVSSNVQLEDDIQFTTKEIL